MTSLGAKKFKYSLTLIFRLVSRDDYISGEEEEIKVRDKLKRLQHPQGIAIVKLSVTIRN